MNDNDFDNDDNKYGKFVYHMYTNMDGPDDILGKRSNFNDIEVPLEICNSDAQNADWRTGGIKYYCPKYDSSTFLHGGFTASKYNWHRLTIHVCDNSEKAKKQRERDGKRFIECASRNESLQYFENTIIGLETWAFEASIKEDFSRELYSRDKPGENKTT